MNNNLIFETINKILLNSSTPSEDIIELSKFDYFNTPPFNMLLQLKLTEQSPIYHKEGNVFNHTMLSLEEAYKVKLESKNVEVFMWAVLLHDIGKIKTTKKRNGKITSYNHDKVGYTLTKKFFSYSNFNKSFIEDVALLVRWHMQVFFVVNGLPFAEIEKMVKDVDIKELSLVALCDRIGRKDINKDTVREDIKKFKKLLNVV